MIQKTLHLSSITGRKQVSPRWRLIQFVHFQDTEKFPLAGWHVKQLEGYSETLCLETYPDFTFPPSATHTSLNTSSPFTSQSTAICSPTLFMPEAGFIIHLPTCKCGPLLAAREGNLELSNVRRPLACQGCVVKGCCCKKRRKRANRNLFSHHCSSTVADRWFLYPAEETPTLLPVFPLKFAGS